MWWGVAALKAAAALSVLATAALVARIAPSRGVSPLGAVAFVALNPLVLIHVVGGAHNDAIAMLAATLGIAAMLSAREASAGAAFVAAFAIKAPAAIAAPFALVSSARLNRLPPNTGANGSVELSSRPLRHLLASALATALAIGAAAYAAFGWHWLHALELLGRHQHKSTHLSIPSTFARLTGLDETAVRTTALTLFATAFAYLLLRTWRGADWLRCAAWASVAPPTGNGLAPPLVPDLGPPARRPFTRPSLTATNPHAYRLPAPSPHAPLSLGFARSRERGPR